MNRYYLEITIHLQETDASQMDALFEPLADATYDLDGVIDADLGARLDEGEFDFTMAIDAEDEPDALGKGLAAVRCAIHAAGGSTPGWETIQQVVRSEPAVA